MKIKVEAKLSFEEYFKLNAVLSYRHPITIILTLLGAVQLVFVTLYFFSNDKLYSNTPYIQLFFGLFCIVGMPYFIYRSSKQNYLTQKILQEKIIYEFTDEKYKIMGETFNAELEWINVVNVLELKDWVLLYHNKTIANMIPKKSFGDELDVFLNFIKKKRIKNSIRR